MWLRKRDRPLRRGAPSLAASGFRNRGLRPARGSRPVSTAKRSILLQRQTEERPSLPRGRWEAGTVPEHVHALRRDPDASRDIDGDHELSPGVQPHLPKVASDPTETTMGESGNQR